MMTSSVVTGKKEKEGKRRICLSLVLLLMTPMIDSSSSQVLGRTMTSSTYLRLGDIALGFESAISMLVQPFPKDDVIRETYDVIVSKKGKAESGKLRGEKDEAILFCFSSSSDQIE